ncbi:hypothetical protein VSX64_06195 [Aurantimonas sp. C2-6-R+9]|uniref:hypothetical protein n=1 Tax=unclassified Aurantimonas TaxID=2638230 RepID=UPI002E185550|nr:MULTISPECIES: hypothetical protein [unclassified Aurantimonas]MEC5290513.1 hypothetical protein [Aurantimonas sp. C2-3-R2]MEC5380478.1 hypothetical protein [Aurantimonas sp. C2-6-R+9]MEC5411524.1 hypothetical protein [Aurantimonas sp. C2-4-R8]
MTTGLQSFDNFSWASLLAGRDVLICDGDADRALKTANALERAGARATIAESQRVALDRMSRRDFALAVVVLEGQGELDATLSGALATSGTKLLLMVDAERREATRKARPNARVASLGMSERQLVMFLTGTSDE